MSSVTFPDDTKDLSRAVLAVLEAAGFSSRSIRIYCDESLEKTLEDLKAAYQPGAPLTRMTFEVPLGWMDANEPRLIYEVLLERMKQYELFGATDWPDGTGSEASQKMLETTRALKQQAFAAGQGTWNWIFREELCEVQAEADPHKLVEELIDVAAVCLAWAAHIRRRVGRPETAAEAFRAHRQSCTTCTDQGLCTPALRLLLGHIRSLPQMVRKSDNHPLRRHLDGCHLCQDGQFCQQANQLAKTFLEGPRSATLGA